MFSSKQKEITLYSNLSLEECKQRLLKNIDTSSYFKRLFFGFLIAQPSGKLSRDILSIQQCTDYKYYPYARMVLNTVLTAKLRFKEGATVITCSFGISKLNEALLTLWFGPLIVCVFLYPLLIPFCFLLLYWGYICVQSALVEAKGEDLYLLEFVKTILDASEQNASS